MSPATASALSRIAPLDLDHALDVYAARLAGMSDEQLTEERHRLANAEFERRAAGLDLVAAISLPARWEAKR